MQNAETTTLERGVQAEAGAPTDFRASEDACAAADGCGIRERARKTAAVLAVLVAVALAYPAYLSTGAPGIPCVIHAATGFLCPGCGTTSMCLSLLHGDVAGAFAANPVVAAMLPLIAAGAAVYAVRYIRYDTKDIGKAGTVLCWVAIGVLVVFGIVRNLPFF